MPPKAKVIPEPNVEVPDGDAGAGRGIFDSQCSACHAIEGDDKTAAAPSLGGLFGRKAGSTAFPYSKAMKGAGFTWSEKHFWVYIKGPGKYVPGNKMAFAGIDDDKSRADLIAFLKSV